MASLKISNLPAASSVTNASLIAVVNGSVTQKATISQLPLGINSVNNLGGGTTLGAISSSELQLKTLIAGTGLAFTTTSNTITFATTLGVTSVGSGTSLINSYTNPNLALKSITGSNGITVTNNTTSVNISNTIDTTKDSIIGSIEVPIIKEYVLEPYINKAYTVNNLYLLTSSGVATVRLKTKDATNTVLLTGSTFTANTTRSTNIVTSFACSMGHQLVLEVITTTSSLDLSFAVDLTYT